MSQKIKKNLNLTRLTITMHRSLAIILAICLVSMASMASATTLRVSGPKEVGEEQKFNISIKSTVDNLAAFEITIEAENVEFVTAYRGEAIKDWGFSYKTHGQSVKIIGVYNQKPVSGTAIELAKLNYIVYENTTFIIDRKSKLINPDEEEIKIDRFYNHSVRVYRYGDVNMDGRVDVKDLIRLEKIILMEEAETVSSDLNDDNSVNILDLVRLINLLVE